MGRFARASLLLLVLAGCGGPTAERGQTADDVTVPRRVALLAPAAAEMLDALGLLDRVVGVGEFGPWPPEIDGLPRIGGYDSPNVERLLSLKADLVLTVAGQSAAAFHPRLEELGIRVVGLDTSTHDGVFASLQQVGALFDRRVETAAIAETMRSELDAIRSAAETLPRRRVLFVVGRDPLYVAGPGSHVDEMIRSVGGINVAADALRPYQQWSLESVLERMPQVIVDTSDNRPGAPRGRLPGGWDRFDFLPAVQENRVYWVSPARLVIPGLRLPEMTRLLGKLVQPERFGEATAEELE